MIIQPTPGRVVWFRPTRSCGTTGFTLPDDPSQPLAAIVTYVWSDNRVNLAVFDVNGVSESFPSVYFRQDHEPEPEGEAYAEWMPYQLGQAKRHAEEAGAAGMREGDVIVQPEPSIHPYPRFGDRVKERERQDEPAGQPEGERQPPGESPHPEGA